MDLRGKIIHVLGDSITQGCGVSGEKYIYHAVLGRAVGAKTVRNYGISGTRIARQQGPDMFESCWTAFADRYHEMENDADLVLVFGGTNDYGHGNAPFGTMEDRTPETFCGACHLLFRGLVEKYPQAKIVVMTPMQREGGGQPSAFRPEGRPLLDYVDAIAEIAGVYSLPVLDLYRTAGICPDIPAQKELFCPDGLHPNDAGAARIAERLEAFLRTL